MYIEPHARWISTPPSTASTPTATEDSDTCAVRRAWRVHGEGLEGTAGGLESAEAWRARRARRAYRMDGAKGFELCGSAPKAHLGLGGDEHVLRAQHERRLELGPELGLDLAAHRAAWRLCGLEALGVRDEREQEHGGAEHRCACLEARFVHLWPLMCRARQESGHERSESGHEPSGDPRPVFL